jgi:putative transposase
MILSIRFRALPTKGQHRALETILEAQRDLYNAALQERIDAFHKAGITRTYFDQTKALTEWRRDDPEAARLPANLQRETLKRLDVAYSQFLRRARRGESPGMPRFRGKGRFNGFGFRQFSGIMWDGRRLRFKGLAGGLRVHVHTARSRVGHDQGVQFST